MNVLPKSHAEIPAEIEKQQSRSKAAVRNRALLARALILTSVLLIVVGPSFFPLLPMIVSGLVGGLIAVRVEFIDGDEIPVYASDNYVLDRLVLAKRYPEVQADLTEIARTGRRPLMSEVESLAEYGRQRFLDELRTGRSSISSNIGPGKAGPL